MKPIPAPAIVELRDVSLAYRQGALSVQVLHDVSFDVAVGEVFGLVGESGCGKSSLAYLLLGYRQPESDLLGGSIRFEGQDLLALGRKDLDRLRGNRIALIPQNPATALSPAMRIGSQVAQVLRRHRTGEDAKPVDARVAELFAAVGLDPSTDFRRRYPHQLSGGQQQRVAIAMALACDPALLVLDEPTTGLDVTTQEQIIALLAHLRERLGTAMLYVTHDLGVLAQIADRVGIMYAGHLVEVSPAGQLFRDPLHPYARGLIAALPRLHRQADSGERLQGLLRRRELPPGCPFQPRCPHAAPACARNRQRLAPVGPGRFVACERLAEIPAATIGRPVADMEIRETTRGAELLRLEDVSLAYGRIRDIFAPWRSRPAIRVRDLSLTIGAGEVFALVGESGSGKSTVAKAISGLLAPLTGSIAFAAGPLPALVEDRSPDLRRRIQYIFQNPDASLNPRLRVGQALLHSIAAFFSLTPAAARNRVAAALEDVKLDRAYLGRFPAQLSGGERQRVAIARALVAEPELLLCDEILSALDVSVQASILELLRTLKREKGLAMLFISHDLAVVRWLADRVGVLFRGALCETGTVDEVFSPPHHPYTKSLLTAAPAVDKPRLPRAAAGSIELRKGGGAGCHYASRCTWHLGGLCDEITPPWRRLGPTHGIRCHLPADELVRRSGEDGCAGPSPWDEGRESGMHRGRVPAAAGEPCR